MQWESPVPPAGLRGDLKGPAQPGLTRSQFVEWEDSHFNAPPPWEEDVAGSKEPSGEEFCTPKYYCGVSTPRAFTTSGSLDEDSWLPRSSHFDPVQEGDPVSSQRHQFVQDPGPITGAQFFNWQQHPDEQTEEHTASYTSEVASFDVAGVTGTAAAGPETRGGPKTRRKRGKKHRPDESPEGEAHSRSLRRKVGQLVAAVARDCPDVERLVLAAYDLTSDQDEVIRPILERMLLSLTDPEYPLDMPALGVALDAADHGDRPQERAIVVASANVSSWRREILDWVTAQHAHVWCVQETHLSKDGATLLRQQAAAKGFASFGGEGSEPNPRPRGGHCVLAAANQHGQALGAFNIEGCGFTGVMIPACKGGLAVYSLYLLSGAGLQRATNAEILGALAAELKGHPNFLVLGDWNNTPDELNATRWPELVKGTTVTTGGPTLSTGRELDFGLISTHLQGLIDVHISWEVPFRPHGALFASVQLHYGEVPLPQHSTPTARLREVEQAADDFVKPQLGEVAGVPLVQDPATQRFADFTGRAELHLFGRQQHRGAHLPVVCKPLARVRVEPRWSGPESSRLQVLAAWAAAAESGQLHPKLQQELADAVERLGKEGQLGGATTASQLGDLAKAATKRARESETLAYQQWLEIGTAKGMRPLFRAVKSQEATSQRPFRDKDIRVRGLLRLEFWAQLWRSASVPPPPLPARLTEAARAQAHLRGLPSQILQTPPGQGRRTRRVDYPNAQRADT